MYREDKVWGCGSRGQGTEVRCSEGMSWCLAKDSGVSLRVHVPKDWVLEGLALEVVLQALGKYMIIGYLVPSGLGSG